MLFLGSHSLTPVVLAAQSENDVLGGSYAIALVEAAQESNTLEAVHADMDALARILEVPVTHRSLVYTVPVRVSDLSVSQGGVFDGFHRRSYPVSCPGENKLSGPTTRD